MKVINNSIYNLSHLDFQCEVGSFLDVPKEVADLWLKIDGVKPYVTPEDVEAEKQKAVEEAIKAERAKIKAEAEKPAKKTTKKK